MTLYAEIAHYLDFAPEGYAEPMEISALVGQIEGLRRPVSYTALREMVVPYLAARGFLDAAIDSVSGTLYDYNFAQTFHQEHAA